MTQELNKLKTDLLKEPLLCHHNPSRTKPYTDVSHDQLVQKIINDFGKEQVLLKYNSKMLTKS